MASNEDQATSGTGNEPQTGTATAGDAAPEKKATKRAPRRATKKTAAPDPAAAGDRATGGAVTDHDGDVIPAPPPGPEVEQSVPKAPRKRASRKKVDTGVDDAPAAGAPAADAPGRDTAAQPAADQDASAQDAAVQGAAADGDSAAVAPRFGLLFQAPEPTARPRRRASAPAAAPFAAAPGRAVDIERGKDDGPQAPRPAQDSDRGPEIETGPAAGPDAESGPQADADSDDGSDGQRRRRRRGGKGRRGRGAESDGGAEDAEERLPQAEGDENSYIPAGSTELTEDNNDEGTRRRTRRRRRASSGDGEDAPGVVTRVREARRDRDEVTSLKGSTRLEAKKQRRREGREAGRRRTVITEAEFLARRESVERVMVVRNKDDRTQIGVLEDDVLVEHYISRETNVSMAGNIYLGRVQNVLPSMEAAFVDIGKGRNAVLYAGEVNWDAAGLEANQPRRIEHALSSGESVLVQVTKDPMGHKGARLTSQVSLPGRYLVYVPDSSMTGISRKLPDTERARLKRILREVVPESAGVIVRTAAEGASEEELRADVERLTQTWEDIRAKADKATSKGKGSAAGSPVLLHGEPDLTVRVIRDIFNEDFASLVVAGEQAWDEVNEYVSSVAPDLAPRVSRWTREDDLFSHYRVDEQIAKAMDRKVWLPSGGSLVIDRTEAMTVVDVNTGKFVGSGGNLEQTVTKNNIEAAEEIVRQLRLRDIGGIIVIDFIDMVLESNRDLVVRRLLECLGRDRTKHQVAEVTSLGLVQMTRKRVGSGLIEVFSETCEHCGGRGIIVHADPVDAGSADGDTGAAGGGARGQRGRRGRGTGEQGGSGPNSGQNSGQSGSGQNGTRRDGAQHLPAPTGPTAAQIAAAAHAAALKSAMTASPAVEVPGQATALVVQTEDPPGAAATDAVPASEPTRTWGPASVTPDRSATEHTRDAAEHTHDAGEQAHDAGEQAHDAGEQAHDGTEQAHDETERTPDGTERATGAPLDPPADERDATDRHTPDESHQSAVPTRRGGRRRGRVVAPAGPPRAVEVE
ncbi:MAG: Rne/Rng family ribonuclease [Lapillicoccus sp.]